MVFSTEGSWTFTGAVALGFADNEQFYSLFKKKNKQFKTTALQLKRIRYTSHASWPHPPFSTAKNGSGMLCRYIQATRQPEAGWMPTAVSTGPAPQRMPGATAPPEGIAPTASIPSKEHQECVSVALFFLQTIDMYCWELGISSQWP